MGWNSAQPLEHLLAILIENLVLSQQLGVVTNRFEGGQQRLRIILEEGGLEALVESLWQPRITADRRATRLPFALEGRCFQQRHSPLVCWPANAMFIRQTLIPHHGYR